MKSNETRTTHWNFIWNAIQRNTVLSLLAGSSLAVCWYSRERSWIMSTTVDLPNQMGPAVPDGVGVWRYVNILSRMLMHMTILTLSIYFQSWPSPMCILENHQFLFCRHCNLFNLQSKPHFALGCQITPITPRLSERFWTWGKKVSDCNSDGKIWKKSKRVAAKVMKKLHSIYIYILHLCMKFHTFSVDTFLSRGSTSVLQRRTWLRIATTTELLVAQTTLSRRWGIKSSMITFSSGWSLVEEFSRDVEVLGNVDCPAWTIWANGSQWRALTFQIWICTCATFV